MLTKAMEKALNEQINEELFSFYIYLAMAASLDDQYFKGMARWMRKQAEEEMSHAMKIFDYIQDRGGTVVLQAIKQPPKQWESPLVAFDQALEHEKHISKCIAGLVD